MIAARTPARRSGITLTEILIAILIMGVGLISLATLFPLGLLRLREATRLGRSALEARTATDDTDARALLYKPSFLNTWYGTRDPFVQDCNTTGAWNSGSTPLTGNGILASGSLFLPQNNLSYGNTGATTDVGNLTSGLPICYDPLWRSLTGVMPLRAPLDILGTTKTTQPLFDPTLTLPSGYTTFAEARFGSGFAGATTTTPYLPADADGDPASAHGLQRLTNMIPWVGPGVASAASTSGNLNAQYNFTCTNLYLGTAQPTDVAGNVFTNIDDIVFNPIARGAGAPSSLVPDLSSGGPQNDYRFSWFFTGQQTDAGGNGSQFVGNIVVCENRQFAVDPTTNNAVGETTVEAIYGYGGNSKAVLLRWSSTLPDPQIRVGGWFADTTYERSVSRYRSRTIGLGTAATATPFARCNWYQIAKRTDPTADATRTGYRSAVVTLTAPVRTMTPTIAATGATETTPANQNYGSPVHVNVACIMPSVVNVFPRSFEVH